MSVEKITELNGVAFGQTLQRLPKEPQIDHEPCGSLRKRLKTRLASEISPLPTEWLWRPWLPKGELVGISGKPGTRKSTITRWVALQVAKGLPFPGDAHDLGHVPNRVLYAGVEDSLPKTVIPQWRNWEATNADLDRIKVVEEPFELDDNGVAMLQHEIKEWGPAIVVIDPIVVFMGDQVDMNRQNQVRGILHPLLALAQEFNITVIFVAHAKKGGGPAIDAVMGSMDFVATVRSSVMIFLDGETSIMAHAKINIDKKGRSLRFRLNDEGQFQWLGEDDRTADDLQAKPHTSETHAKRKHARDFLLKTLDRGEVLADTLKEEANKQGISWKLLGKVRKEDMKAYTRQLYKAEKLERGLDPLLPAWVWGHRKTPDDPGAAIADASYSG